MKNVHNTSVELLLCNARGVFAPQSITLSSEMIDNEESLRLKRFHRANPIYCTLERIKETAEAVWMK